MTSDEASEQDVEREKRVIYKTVPPDVRSSLGEYLDIALGDARIQFVEDNSVDLIVSSSPYVTSYEYADLHQLSTVWLDFTEDLKQYRTSFIGSSSRLENQHMLKSEVANDVVLKMKDRNEKHSQEIASFFLDMEQVFDESYRILKPRGRCCFVIGNTFLKSVNILNAQVFAESIQDLPWTRSSSERFLQRYSLRLGIEEPEDFPHPLRLPLWHIQWNTSSLEEGTIEMHYTKLSEEVKILEEQI